MSNTPWTHLPTAEELSETVDPHHDSTAAADSPPHAPSQAWLAEYNAAMAQPRAPADRRRQPYFVARGTNPPILVPNQSYWGTAPDESSTRTVDERPRQRRRLDGPERDDENPIPSIENTVDDLFPTLRRSRSSWRNSSSLDALRDLDAARAETDAAFERLGVAVDQLGNGLDDVVQAQGGRDTRRDGLIFERLSPALPSSSISVSSAQEGLFGPSSHLPATGHDSEDALRADLMDALGTERIGRIMRDRRDQRQTAALLEAQRRVLEEEIAQETADRMGAGVEALDVPEGIFQPFGPAEGVYMGADSDQTRPLLAHDLSVETDFIDGPLDRRDDEAMHMLD